MLILCLGYYVIWVVVVKGKGGGARERNGLCGLRKLCRGLLFLLAYMRHHSPFCPPILLFILMHYIAVHTMHFCPEDGVSITVL
jgi:hypothetical protein